jgi:hypothetical protein
MNGGGKEGRIKWERKRDWKQIRMERKINYIVRLNRHNKNV